QERARVREIYERIEKRVGNLSFADFCCGYSSDDPDVMARMMKLLAVYGCSGDPLEISQLETFTNDVMENVWNGLREAITESYMHSITEDECRILCGLLGFSYDEISANAGASEDGEDAADE
ncbi:MAG: hypothetical protein JXR97_16550, partial [Planctomycetes bacterium]|nr:hypothetical protein [Planctomycetota bacterium]